MVRSIIMVAALLAGFCYCAAFLMWNAELTSEVVVWHLGGPQQWIPDVPIAFLSIVGMMIGAVIMAVGAWMPWATQRNAARAARAKMTKAIERFNEQKEQIEAQRVEIAQLREQLEQAETAAQAAAAESAPVADPAADFEWDDEDDEAVPEKDELTL